MGPPPAADHSSSASPAEGTIVPIATLLLPPDPMARTPFEVSFSTLHRRRHGMDQVTAAGSPDAPVVPGAPTTPGDVAAIVPIEELLYRGDAALGRLGEIQAVLKTLRSPAPAPETLSALLDECLDLIPLALDVTH